MLPAKDIKQVLVKSWQHQAGSRSNKIRQGQIKVVVPPARDGKWGLQVEDVKEQ